MKEIKFRGKQINTGEWIYGYYSRLNCNQESFISFWGMDKSSDIPQGYHIYQIDEKTLGQFICRKDSLDRDIYEDDILEVTYDNQTAYVVVNRNDVEYKYLSNNENIFKSEIKSMKILGNIHDNPELIFKKIHTVLSAS